MVAASPTFFDIAGAPLSDTASPTFFDLAGAPLSNTASPTLFDVAETPVPVGHFGGTTGAVVSASTPLQTFGGVSGNLALLMPSANVYGGATGNSTIFAPSNVFGASTGGSTAFSGVPPAANLVATPVNVGKIALTWVDVSDLETGFRIERSPNGQGAWVAIGSVGANVTIFVDHAATPLVVYDYRVIAFNPADEAEPSNIASAYSPAAGQPAPPSSGPIPRRLLEFLSPGVYGLERDPDGNTGGNKF